MRKLLVPAMSLGLVACSGGSAVESAPAPVPKPLAYTCDASGLQEHIGHKATAQSGETLLTLSGARTLRWGPPGSLWTMDYRKDRLNVRYDSEMTIIAITCG